MIEIVGWKRTALLALGAFGGVFVTAAIIHYLKEKGWAT